MNGASITMDMADAFSHRKKPKQVGFVGWNSRPAGCISSSGDDWLVDLASFYGRVFSCVTSPKSGGRESGAAVAEFAGGCRWAQASHSIPRRNPSRLCAL
jgi:hypothetical protein